LPHCSLGRQRRLASPPRRLALPTLDLVPAFIGACMNPGPDADKIRAVVLKAGGKAAPQQVGRQGEDRLEGFVFDNSGAPYSVHLRPQRAPARLVGGHVDVEVTRASLDRLVIGSSKVFDISQTEAKAHVAGETVAVEYRLTSKTKKGGCC
jgi:hypothetical protein